MDEHFATREVDDDLEEMLWQASEELSSRVNMFMDDTIVMMGMRGHGEEFAARMDALRDTVQEAIDHVKSIGRRQSVSTGPDHA